jgi:hypothetical protein
MANTLTLGLVRIAFALSGIWIVLWLAKKISVPTLIVCLLCTYIGYQILKLVFQSMQDSVRVAYATAGRNERLSQNLLVASTEQTQQCRWKFYTTILIVIGAVLKYLPVLIQWLHHA